MPDYQRPSGFKSPIRPLAERVSERVATAASRLARRERSARHRLGGPVSTEAWALRRVFRDMGRTQRAMRRQSGQAPFAVVRTAADAFKREPTLAALVGVAATLEEVGLLGW
jgi:hypothetical protein